MQEYDRERCLPTAALHERTREALERFLDCLVRQDVAGLESLLAESTRTITDAGGEYTALASALVGRGRVASFHLKVAKRRAPISRIEIRTVNGLPAAVIESRTNRLRQAPRIVLRCELDSDGRIRELHSILASRKLAAIRFSGAT
jgi:RNA polymerase sigma-70 factor (ECF subfamily)